MTYISSFSRRYRSTHRTVPILPLTVIAILSLGFAYVHTQDFKSHHPAASANNSTGSRVEQVKPLAEQQYQQNAPLETVDESGPEANAAPTSDATTNSQPSPQQSVNSNTTDAQQATHNSLLRTLLHRLSL